MTTKLMNLESGEVSRFTYSDEGGLIFACWDASAGSLDEYLGDFRYYLDTGRQCRGHSGAAPGRHGSPESS
ncbi:MAG TPA: hypothetical protein VFC51_02905 [Chloroflexota bacterium]|nr:hypothetical protein [Chloroflexota bacterium]